MQTYSCTKLKIFYKTTCSFQKSLTLILNPLNVQLKLNLPIAVSREIVNFVGYKFVSNFCSSTRSLSHATTLTLINLNWNNLGETEATILNPTRRRIKGFNFVRRRCIGANEIHNLLEKFYVLVYWTWKPNLKKIHYYLFRNCYLKNDEIFVKIINNSCTTNYRYFSKKYHQLHIFQKFWGWKLNT